MKNSSIFTLALLALVAISFTASITKQISSPDVIYYIAPASIPSGTVGVPYSVTFAAAPYNPNYQWTVSGQPPGLVGKTVDTTLKITGVPTRSGYYVLRITVTNGVDVAKISVPLSISQPITPAAT